MRCAVRNCVQRGHHVWNICADGPERAICTSHDVELNALVMRWAFGSTREADIAAYAKRLGVPMPGHQIKIGRGHKIKNGKIEKTSTARSVSDKIRQKKSKRVKVARRVA